MQDEHKAAIEKCLNSLVEQTDLDTMVSALCETGLFSKAVIEPYKDNSKSPEMRKRQLYTNVMHGGSLAFGCLIDALVDSGYWHLAKELDPSSPQREPNSNTNSSLSESEWL